MQLYRHLQTDGIIWRTHKILFRAEVSFRGLNRRVAEQQLNLLQLAAGRAAQLGAGASKVVRRDSGRAYFGRILTEHLPDDLLAQASARNKARPAHRAEYVASSKAGRRRPGVDSDFHLRRHRRGADATARPHEIDNAPAFIALLYMSGGQRGHLGTSEAAAEQNG